MRSTARVIFLLGKPAERSPPLPAVVARSTERGIAN